MKNIRNIALILAAIAAATSFTACSFGGEMSYTSNPNSSAASSNQSSDITSSGASSVDGTTTNTPLDSTPLSSDSNTSGDNIADMTVSDRIKEAIVKAYGDNYLPNMQIPAENLQSEFGITPDMYDELVAEMPTIGFHPDRLVIVKAKEGKKDAIKKAFENAKKNFNDAATQYPANLAKVNACKILENGDYICFMLLGQPDETGENDDAAAKFAEEQVQIGVKAFENYFKQV